MQQSSQMPALLEQLRRDPSLAERLPSQESAMVRGALDGKSVYEIASACQTSEASVWRVLGSAAREASGAEVHPVETGGFGSDTEPGVTGGYGETGFGSLGNEPDLPVPGEPDAMGEFHDLDRDAARLAAGDQERRQEKPAKTPQTPHPSQAEGDDREDNTPVESPQTPHPSQAEGDEESVDESLRRQERDGQ